MIFSAVVGSPPGLLIIRSIPFNNADFELIKETNLLIIPTFPGTKGVVYHLPS